MITTMCQATDEGARDVSAVWSNSFGSSVKPEDRKMFVRDTYQGCVLETYERNGYDDSDFYALVWDEASQSVHCIEYASTRGWSYANGASVDATPEVQAKARAYYLVRYTKLNIELAEREAKKAAKGKVCTVVKGRKIAKGEVVTVIGNPVLSVYGMGRWAKKTYNVLVRLASGTMVKTNIENLQVNNPEQFFITEDAAKAKAAPFVASSNWRSLAEAPFHMIMAGMFH